MDQTIAALNFLIDRGLAVKEKHNGMNVYFATSKGQEYIR